LSDDASYNFHRHSSRTRAVLPFCLQLVVSIVQLTAMDTLLHAVNLQTMSDDKPTLYLHKLKPVISVTMSVGKSRRDFARRNHR